MFPGLFCGKVIVSGHLYSERVWVRFMDTLREIEMLREELDRADAILIGAGAGLSSAAGLTRSGERFRKYFSDFADKYGISDMYSGGFYPFDSMEEFWAWWSRQIWYNRYEPGALPLYRDLLSIVKDREYFVLTTNADHQFQKAGFDKERLFYMQGDYGLFQCGESCHNKTYDNKAAVHSMLRNQKDMRIPAELIPKCPLCGRPMSVNLRCDDTFVQDAGWFQAGARYREFVSRHKEDHILFLEIGVGMNIPVIIKYPFWKMTEKNSNAVYACINRKEAFAPAEIQERSILIRDDIVSVIRELLR